MGAHGGDGGFQPFRQIVSGDAFLAEKLQQAVEPFHRRRRVPGDQRGDRAFHEFPDDSAGDHEGLMQIAGLRLVSLFGKAGQPRKLLATLQKNRRSTRAPLQPIFLLIGMGKLSTTIQTNMVRQVSLHANLLRFTGQPSDDKPLAFFEWRGSGDAKRHRAWGNLFGPEEDEIGVFVRMSGARVRE